MKKILLYGVTVLAIVGLAVFNININMESKSITNLRLIDIEALGGAEWGGWSNFSQGQGFWLDEEELKEPCPSEQSSSGGGSASYGGGSASGNGSSSQSNPPDRHDIRCKYGNQNCTSVSC
jgi:hypothetical protein